MFLTSINIYGQVGINTDKPNAYAGLHISERKDPASADPDKYSGIIIQRYTEAQRDAKLTPNMATGQNSLMIYNTTEDCYNYWNQAEGEWKSLCGKLGKSQFTFDCSALQVKGTYVQGRELTASNYLSIPVTVTKAGEYTFLATTTNGYSFFASGTFLNTGSYTIKATGQGTPVVVQTDNLAINANSIDVTCTPARTVTVLSAAATYTMSCGSSTVNGVYKVGTALTASNTITLPVNVTSLGSYTITTNTVDGISFSASGTFTTTGNQNITLNGTGTPSSTTAKTLTITSDSQGGVSTTCNVNVIVVIPKKRLLTFGESENGFGYNFSGIAASNKLITTASNFGTTNNSVVKYEGWTSIINGGNTIDGSEANYFTTDPVDIIILGYNFIITAQQADLFAQYLAKGGVVIAYTDRGNDLTSTDYLLRKVFNDPSFSSVAGWSSGARYQFGYDNIPVLNGPFRDIRGLFWGEDASTTAAIPASYSIPNATVLSKDGLGRTTAFIHNTYNFIWVGDGGFNSNNGGTDTTICPFKLDTNNYPILKPNYNDNAAEGGIGSVYNSIFTANAFAWALEKAEHNGINKH